MGYSNKVAIAVCDRCNFKMLNSMLREDGNVKGMRVCEDCRDEKDQWRLPPLKPDSLTLRYPRPDTPLWPMSNRGFANGIPLWDENDIAWDDGVTQWVGP